MAPSRNGTSSALTTNPDRSGALITVLPRVLVTRSVTRWTACGLVSTDGITSTSRCTGTGLKKCRPTTCAGRVVAWATWMMGIEEVLVARITSGRSAAWSSSANSAALTAGFSVAASITSSRSARSSRRGVSVIRASAASRSSAVSFPALTARASEASIRASPASAAAASTSRTTTSRPARAQTSAMPDPISPQPATPTRVISLMWFPSGEVPAALAAGFAEPDITDLPYGKSDRATLPRNLDIHFDVKVIITSCQIQKRRLPAQTYFFTGSIRGRGARSRRTPGRSARSLEAPVSGEVRLALLGERLGPFPGLVGLAEDLQRRHAELGYTRLRVGVGVEGVLEEAQRGRRQPRHLLRPAQRLRQQFAGLDHGVDQTPSLGRLGVVQPAEKPHLARPLLADHAGQEVRAEARGEPADP